MHRRLPAVLSAASVLVLALALSGCGSDSSDGPRTTAEQELSATPAAQVSAAPSADAKVIAIKIAGDTVEPSGERVEVKANQPIVLQINADKAGELHVHSSPEKHIEFPKGGSEITLKLDQPGVVDVEDHALDKLIVQLEVR
jgi:hypothetical protein